MIFNFKQFAVKHSDSLLKVNTDAVLLGALIDLDNETKSILDIGTGCGVIALMAAQKFTNSKIDALEIDKPSCEEAAYNFANSKFSSRLNAYHTSLQNFVTDKRYDLIISNPPYFEVPDFSKGNNLQDINEGRKKVATRFTLTFEELILFTSGLLGKEGKFWVIIPYNAKEGFVKTALLNNLNLQKEIRIQSNPGYPFNRCVLSFSFEKDKHADQNTIIIYNPDGTRHNDYVKITEEYYL